MDKLTNENIFALLLIFAFVIMYSLGLLPAFSVWLSHIIVGAFAQH